jgi:hypothetical protein
MIKRCKTPGCRNKPAPEHLHCAKCLTRAYRERHPVKAAYLHLKHNAKRRGKLFTLTFAQFECFAIETEYMVKKGRTRGSFHVDRIREEDGYTVDNIQAITNIENLHKYLTWRWDEQERRMSYRVETAKKIDDSNEPF